MQTLTKSWELDQFNWWFFVFVFWKMKFLTFLTIYIIFIPRKVPIFKTKLSFLLLTPYITAKIWVETTQNTFCRGIYCHLFFGAEFILLWYFEKKLKVVLKFRYKLNWSTFHSALFFTLKNLLFGNIRHSYVRRIPHLNLFAHNNLIIF